MNIDFDFSDLFVLDMANNHQGSLVHGLDIIAEHGKAVAACNAKAALKFQFRQMETFIHPSHQQGSDNKHIPRFLSTYLKKEQYAKLAKTAKEAGMLTMATPFDEESLPLIEELDIDIIKIASCSALDWPLIEAIAEHNRPVIVSTGGLTLDQIDDIVSFFDHRRVHFAIMHCVSIYPTPNGMLELNQIETIRTRHPKKVVGFSTHEAPGELSPAMVAIAKGAQILERHIGLETPEIKLNAYSSTPAQVEAWIKAAQAAQAMCGHKQRMDAPEQEVDALESLQRGVYANSKIMTGQEIRREDVFFAMPIEDGQLSSGEFKPGIFANQTFDKNDSLKKTSLSLPKLPENLILLDAIHEIKSMLNEAKIALPIDFGLEFSHHYGIAKFPDCGAVLIDIVNRSYCKKLIVQLPGQSHPNHYHKRKEETFQVLHGTLDVLIEDRSRSLEPGDLLVVPQGVWHSFSTKTGVIFEEVSTKHYNDDSYYEDKDINRSERSARKTKLSQWGRYQLS